MRYKKTVYCGRVAQLDRVPGYEPGGRRFDSCRVRHIEKTSLMTGFFSPKIFRQPLIYDNSTPQKNILKLVYPCWIYSTLMNYLFILNG
jgi:hypothetical protein